MSVGAMFKAALPWISTGLNLLSTVKQYQAASTIEKQGKFNAQVFRDEAAAAWRSYNDQAAIQRHEQRLFQGAARAAYGKAGVAMEGTPMEMLADIVYRQELDQVALFNTAAVGQKKLAREAAMAEWRGYQEGSAIRSQALGAFGTALLAPTYRYGTPWTGADTSDAASRASSAPAARRVSPAARGNQVPGARGWRPVRGFN